MKFGLFGKHLKDTVVIEIKLIFNWQIIVDN